MRHRKSHGKLGRTSAHRKALLRNMVTSLLDHEMIETTDAKARRYLIPWTEWHQASDYTRKGYYRRNPAYDGPRLFRVKHNEMTLNMKTTKTVEWDARLLIEPLVDDLALLRFDLVNNGDPSRRWSDDSFQPVRVLSVTDDAGRALSYTHFKDQLLVTLPRPAVINTPLALRVTGKADVINDMPMA